MSFGDLDAAILAAIDEGCDRRMAILDWFTRRQIACTLPQFYAAINRLLEAGVIERSGEKRGTRYRVPEASA